MKHRQPESRAPGTAGRSAEKLADSGLVMLSCRIPSGLRRRLKVAASERGVQMAEIVERAIVRELDRLDQAASDDAGTTTTP
jgi:hypothetical protein